MKGYFVYCLCDEYYSVVYVGSTINLNQRISAHKGDKFKEFTNVIYTELNDKESMLCTEREYIMRYKPKYNKLFTFNVGSFEEPKVWYEMLFPDPYAYDENYIYESYIGYLSDQSGIELRFGSPLSYLIRDKDFGCSSEQGKITFIYRGTGLTHSEFIDTIVAYYNLETLEVFSEKFKPIYRREFYLK